jgi:hypothetical protein
MQEMGKSYIILVETPGGRRLAYPRAIGGHQGRDQRNIACALESCDSRQGSEVALVLYGVSLSLQALYTCAVSGPKYSSYFVPSNPLNLLCIGHSVLELLRPLYHALSTPVTSSLQAL